MTKILGVDVGSYSIKIAELDASNKGYVINNFIELPLTPDITRDRGLEIIEQLRSISKNFNPRSTKWVIGVPQHRVSVRQSRFPFRERSKILKSLPFELEDEIPLDIDETVFDYKTIEYVGASADVLTVAAPFDVVEEILQLAKDGGFDPEIVSVEGLALSNIFENWNQPAPDVNPALRQVEEVTAIVPMPSARAKLILHLGHSRSLLLVYRDNRLIAVRSILWGGAEIAASFSSLFNVAPFESVRILKEKSFILMNSAGATRDQVRLSEAVSKSVDNLIHELRLTLLEVKSAYSLEYSEIQLQGGVSQIQNLAPYITQGLEIPANISQNALADKPSRIQMTPQVAAVAGVAVGLAIEGIKRPRNPAINLRKGDFARENEGLKELIEQWKIPAQVLASAFAMFFVFSVVRDQLAATLVIDSETKMIEAAQTAANLKGGSATENGIRSFISKSNNRIRNQASIDELDNYVPAMDLVAKLSEKFPPKAAAGQPGIDVTLLEIDNDTVVLQGHAGNRDLVAGIERAIDDLAKAKSRKPGPPQSGTVPGVPFSYRFEVNRKP